MNIQGGGVLKLIKVMYVHQAVKNLLVASRFVSKGYTVGVAQDKMAIKKNEIIMILDTRKWGK